MPGEGTKPGSRYLLFFSDPADPGWLYWGSRNDYDSLWLDIVHFEGRGFDTCYTTIDFPELKAAEAVDDEKVKTA